MRALSLLAAPLALLSACGGVGGSLSGADFDPAVGYFGGPFLVFSAGPIDCQDLWWIERNLDEDDRFYDEDFDLILVSFNDSNVVEGSYDVSGASPVSASRLVGTADGFSIDDATSGLLVVDKVTDDKVKGETELQFGAGLVSGSFKVGRCVNLASDW